MFRSVWLERCGRQRLQVVVGQRSTSTEGGWCKVSAVPCTLVADARQAPYTPCGQSRYGERAPQTFAVGVSALLAYMFPNDIPQKECSSYLVHVVRLAYRKRRTLRHWGLGYGEDLAPLAGG